MSVYAIWVLRSEDSSMDLDFSDAFLNAVLISWGAIFPENPIILYTLLEPSVVPAFLEVINASLA